MTCGFLGVQGEVFETRNLLKVEGPRGGLNFFTDLQASIFSGVQPTKIGDPKWIELGSKESREIPSSELFTYLLFKSTLKLIFRTSRLVGSLYVLVSWRVKIPLEPDVTTGIGTNFEISDTPHVSWRRLSMDISPWVFFFFYAEKRQVCSEPVHWIVRIAIAFFKTHFLLRI